MEELKQKIKAALEAARAIAKAAEDENREFTDDERQKVTGYLKEAEDGKKELKRREGDAAMRKAIGDLGEGLSVSEAAAGSSKAVATAQALAKGMTLGEQYVKSEAFQAWMKSVAPNGVIPDSVKGFTAAAMQVPDLFKSLFRGAVAPGGAKDIITGGSATSGGAFVEADYTGIFVPLARRPITILDLISRRTTGSDTVEFVRQTTRTNAAAPVAEATGSASGNSGLKPEGDMAFEKVTATVRTIAEWVAATKRALSDAGQLRGLIDQQLREDLREETEDQVMNGTNTGEDLEGLENTPGTLSQAFVEDVFVTTRRAKTFLRMAGRVMPTAYVMNPEDWQDIELTRDGEDRFYGMGPFANTEPRLWGVPVVESEVVPQGKAWLGRWTDYVIWDREQASIAVSDSPYNFFVRNLVAILGEIRVAGAAIKPSSFVEIDLQTGS